MYDVITGYLTNTAIVICTNIRIEKNMYFGIFMY